MKRNFYIGTSGWSYNDDKKTIFPTTVASKDRLAHYSKSLNSTEVNSTFYHMPRPSTVEGWAAQVPDDFKVSVKLNRQFTHYSKLDLDAENQQKLDEFFDSVRVLGVKLGMVLAQLPPSLKCDAQLLTKFLEYIPNDIKIAIEFRHESWFSDEVKAVMTRHGATWVVNDSPGRWPSERLAGERIYVRMHGREKLYASEYTQEQLADLWRWVESESAREVYIYFNNTMRGSGFRNAVQLRKLI